MSGSIVCLATENTSVNQITQLMSINAYNIQTILWFRFAFKNLGYMGEILIL